jgi:hypothetical protein
MGDARSRRAVEYAERFADSPAHRSDLSFVAASAWKGVTAPATWAAYDSVANEAWRAAYDSSNHAAWAVPHSPRLDELRVQAILLRDISGNPFRPAPAIARSWLAWSGGTVRRLAAAAYDDRDLPSGHLAMSRPALVADALEDSGCADADLLSHLRSAGPHVRGCYAIDLLTGRG